MQRLTEDELNTLATYNAEVGRGIKHTGEWVRKMADLQAQFDEYQRAMSETPFAVALRSDVARLNKMFEPVHRDLIRAAQRIAQAGRPR